MYSKFFFSLGDGCVGRETEILSFDRSQYSLTTGRPRAPAFLLYSC